MYSTNNTTKKYLRNKETKGLRKMQAFIPFLVIHVICSILVKAIIWREDYSNIGPIYKLAMKIMPLLTLYGPNSFFRRFSGHNLR